MFLVSSTSAEAEASTTTFTRARAPFCAAVALAAASMLSAGAANAASDGLFARLQGPAGAESALAGPAQVLPVPKSSKPFRQTIRVLCDATNVCTFPIQKVAKKKLLELQNISCFTTAATSGAILATSPDVAALQNTIVAVIPAINDNAAATNGAGPYFIAGGEQLYILMGGDAGQIGVCALYGTLSKTGKK